MKRQEILETAARLISNEREKQHGDPHETYRCVAVLWQGYFDAMGVGIALSPRDALNMMALLKMARAMKNPANDDNYIDAAGYIALAGENAGRDRYGA